MLTTSPTLRISLLIGDSTKDVHGEMALPLLIALLTVGTCCGYVVTICEITVHKVKTPLV